MGRLYWIIPTEIHINKAIYDLNGQLNCLTEGYEFETHNRTLSEFSRELYSESNQPKTYVSS